MDINCNTNDLSFLGSGYPLFFDYIRYCIYILVIIFVISGVFNLVTNTMASDCLSVLLYYSILSFILNFFSKKKYDDI